MRLPLTDLLRPIDRKVPLNNFAKTWIDRRLEKMHDPFRERRLLVTHYHRRQICLTYENVSLSRLGNESPLQREKAQVRCRQERTITQKKIPSVV